MKIVVGSALAVLLLAGCTAASNSATPAGSKVTVTTTATATVTATTKPMTTHSTKPKPTPSKTKKPSPKPTPSKTKKPPTPVSHNWYPKGYSEFDDGLAVKFYKHPTCDIDGLGGSCWEMNVITRDGCDSLYAELSVLNSNGTNIDFTNDTASSLGPGDKAQLQFQSFADGIASGELTKLDCY